MQQAVGALIVNLEQQDMQKIQHKSGSENMQGTHHKSFIFLVTIA